jgi:hypothetical protein
MRWAPIGATVSVTASSGAATKVISTSVADYMGNMVFRVFNNDTATQSFTIGNSAVTNTKAIPLSAGQDIVISAGQGEAYIAASSTNIRATPGIGLG